jgi:sodium pump decarboxylase gamma subunit
MTELLWQGAQISLIGLGLTFAALALLIGTIWLLRRAFPATAVSAESPTPPETESGDHPPDAADEISEEELVAVIAAAIAHAHTDFYPNPALGDTLAAGPGPWWYHHRPTAVTRHVPYKNGAPHAD